MKPGVLFFPVTPFDADFEVDLAAFTRHMEERLPYQPGAVFVCCGTGEYHSLALPEYSRLIRRAVEIVDGAVPVFAGAGGPVPVAVECARAAEEHGADGLLLLPPYLVTGPQGGLVAYARRVADSTSRQIVLYHRLNALFEVASVVELAAVPNVVGLKDGYGDLEAIGRFISAVRSAPALAGKQFTFFNGLPTAEATARAYRAEGVVRYSSAAFCFVPEIASAFHDALATGDDMLVDSLLARFYHPLAELRSLVPGYGISLIKAGMRLRGSEVGGARPPLTDPSIEHLNTLEALIAQGLASLENHYRGRADKTLAG